MFREALFQLGRITITLPVRNNEIRKIERDYGVTFIKWL